MPGRWTVAGLFCCAVAGCTPVANVDAPPKPKTDVPTAGSTSDPALVFLDQGWSSEIRTKFYTTTQGSRIIPYPWLLALEQAGSTSRFLDDANIRKFGYLPQPVDPQSNPDGLPVGFVADSGSARDWFGLTCAACHTNEIRYGGKTYRVDGAPALADVRAMLSALIESLQKTLADPDKFARFAVKVLADKDSPIFREILKTRMESMIAIRVGYNRRNFPGYDASQPAPPPSDYGRLDAFGAILNEVYYHAQKSAADPTATSKPADAPVNYPFLWDTDGQNLVQWVGLPNGGLDTLARNVGEVLGVFADFKVPEEHFVFGYPSSVRVLELLDLEKWVGELRSPPWPAEFGGIDAGKARLGQAIYNDLCLKCHVIIPHDASDRANTASVSAGGTDPLTFENIFGRVGPSGKLEGSYTNVFGVGDSTKFGAQADGLTMLSNEVIGTILGDWRNAPTGDMARSNMFARKSRVAMNRSFAVRAPGEPENAAPPSPPPAQYKGRALDGIWATAPYLHNGSVPNLRDLLRPASKRATTFTVGGNAFDPKNVGFEVDQPGYPKFRVFDAGGKAIPGNSNAGHEYGTALTDDQVDQLLEYLKSL